MAKQDSDQSTYTNHNQNYESQNEQLRSKIRLLSTEIEVMQELLENHKHCSTYRQNSLSKMDSKAGETASLKCHA
ncbi:hypothetical protein FPOAC2_00179 [Fusarium poae]